MFKFIKAVIILLTMVPGTLVLESTTVGIFLYRAV